MLGWGSSYGAIQGAARRVRREQGVSVATAHIRHLNPLPPNLGEVLRSYERVLVPEMNMGQLVKILRAEFLVDCESFTKVDGLPIFTRDVIEEILARVGGSSNGEARERQRRTTARRRRRSRRRTSPPTRRRAGAPAAATTRCSPRSSRFMPELGIPPDRIVFVTGIGCAGRFVYYMDTYGMHGIHGRAPGAGHRRRHRRGPTCRSGW